MKKRSLLFLLFSLIFTSMHAAKLKGKVTDEKGEALPFASVYLKGTSTGTTTNLDGNYVFELPLGSHILICQYVGYQRQEVEIKIDQEISTKNFILVSRGKELKQVVVKKGEDPAYRMIRKTIKKRSEYNKQIDAYKANAYIKGSIKLNDIASTGMMMSLMGMSKKDSASNQEMEDLKGILMLSESYNEIAYKKPNKLKITVKSSRKSGDRSGYGFSEPLFVNMYDNNVQFSESLSPRGFISPIAETALLSYKYELLETYQEDGKTISAIKVIPRRKFEPVFAGTIHIIEDEWRLHSVDLMVDHLHQLELLDTVQVKQIFVPVNNILMVKDQSFKMKFKLMGFSFSGNFVNVFTDYIFDYDTKKTFDKYKRVYEESALTQTKEYWDTLRPVPLDEEEIADFIKKDSIEKINLAKKDSIKPAKNTLKSFALRGYIKKIGKGQIFKTTPLAGGNQFSWNTVEGVNYWFGLKYINTIDDDRTFSTALKMRYGFSNQQFNAKLTTKYKFGKTNKTNIELSAGRFVFQYNNSEPVNSLINSYYTLFAGRNYLKFYQAWFGEIKMNKKFVSGLTIEGRINYQDRMPLRNTNLYCYRKTSEQRFTENYPTEQLSDFEPRHQALIANVSASFQPGRKYIKYPDRIVSSSSNYPTFGVQYTKGLSILLSDVNYDKWMANMEDDMDFNLWGQFSYRIAVGGFISKEKVYLADFNHFNGNQTILASQYLNSFQLSPYYANSNTEKFFTTLHAEHHFNGLLTNKLPLFRNLKWYLVASGNAYYVNQDNNYIEISAGLENIGYKLFRMFRVDGVVGYSNLKNPVYGIRIGINGASIGISTGNDTDY
ncbi:MAG TPA: DUF5686 and carboxypeptidase regulatory-like domain-containing protein [Chitinophagaceae bacterium]|nr:DUF5686 and carboxypeptidase regulatory-like domain-containing protein [Chitinophagaceae bacterium]